MKGIKVSSPKVKQVWELGSAYEIKEEFGSYRIYIGILYQVDETALRFMTLGEYLTVPFNSLGAEEYTIAKQETMEESA